MITSNSYSNFRPYLSTNENLTKWEQFRLDLFEFMFNPIHQKLVRIVID